MADVTRDILAHANVIGPTILPAESSATSVVAFARGQAEPDTAVEEPPAPEEAPAEGAPDGGEEAPAEEAEPEAPADEGPPETRFRLRFTDLTRQRDAAREQTRLAQQELDYWKQRALTPPPQAPEAPQSPPLDVPRFPNGRPQPPPETGFATVEQYQAARLLYEDALMQWNIQQAFAAQAHQQRETELLKTVQERYPDYTQVTQNSRMQLNQDVSTAILQHPQRFDLVYHLAQHPELEARLAGQYGVGAGLTVALLAQELQTGSAPPAVGHGMPQPPAASGGGPAEPAPPTTHAPPPIAPTRGTGARAPRGYDELSLHEFIARRNDEERRRWS